MHRRHWTDKQTGEIISRNWNVIAKGTQMTTGFSEFLKKLADTKVLICKAIVDLVGVDGKKLQCQYKNKTSVLKNGIKSPLQSNGLFSPKTSPPNFPLMKSVSLKINSIPSHL